MNTTGLYAFLNSSRTRFDLEFRPKFWKPAQISNDFGGHTGANAANQKKGGDTAALNSSDISGVDQADRERFAMPNKEDIDNIDEFWEYNHFEKRVDKEKLAQTAAAKQRLSIMETKHGMAAPPKPLDLVKEKGHLFDYMAGIAPPIKTRKQLEAERKNPFHKYKAKPLFSDFSKSFQFGVVAHAYEKEKRKINREWDRKVPKQHKWGAKRFEIPSAPLPENLKKEPQLTVPQDVERKIQDSRAGQRQ